MHSDAPSPADLFVHGGTLLTPDGAIAGDVLIQGGRIAAVGPQLTAPVSAPRLDATGRLVFPGLIDPQVHFREPGWTHKEDLASGSLSAIAGGVTCFMEMPNTVPTTTDPAALADKLQRAAGRAWADHAFFLGATAENAERLGEWEQQPGCAGVKVFMGSSTGSLLVADDATLERVLRSGTRRVAVHSEHEPRLRERYAALDASARVREHHHVRDVACAVLATERLLNLAEKTGRKIHLLHVSTADEVAMLRERDLGDLVTAEVTPNHLFLSAPECYERWGSLAQMNPPVRDRTHQEALRAGLRDGVLTCIGSDHAPHTLAEKARPYPASPSGIPGVQTILPLLLTAVEAGWLSLADVVRVAASGPAAAYGIEGKGAIEAGYDGDLVLVDPAELGPLRLEWLRSRAGFSPYVGMRLAGWPTATVLRGRLVYARHATLGTPAGEPLRFAGGA
ncbi:MAG: dihydroorotase [Planctomycetes bacterium]|nr:dihydroorotase [Planctomycetota bacterium]